jgi:hypothetical protein
MGVSRVGSSLLPEVGTAQIFGLVATDQTQEKKNPHSVLSPIWMTPNQVTFIQATASDAMSVRRCAQKIVNGQPEVGCSAERIAQGFTCRTPPVRGTVNGATQGAVVSGRVEDTAAISAPCYGTDCSSMCGWTSLHGPFWQEPNGALDPSKPDFYGTALRLYAKDGQMNRSMIAAPRPGESTGTPGGTYECTNLRKLAQPPPDKCVFFAFNVQDQTGTSYNTQTVIGMPSLDVMSGFIGNVAQDSVLDIGDRLNFIMNGSNNVLVQSHAEPAYPLKVGPMKGEAMAYTCNGWSPTYLVRDQYAAGDIELVAAGIARDARCWITGVSGAWSTTRSGGSVQPFAEIYRQGGALRLRVQPSIGNSDHVGAWASCVLTDGTP